MVIYFDTCNHKVENHPILCIYSLLKSHLPPKKVSIDTRNGGGGAWNSQQPHKEKENKHL